MTSFLTTCAQCGTMGPKQGRCPQCGHSDSAIEDIASSSAVTDEFAARYALHARNKGVEMMILLALGFSGMITTLLWLFVIFAGSIGALILVIPFTILSGILSAVRFFSDRWFPTQLLCPSCDARLEALNDLGEECPACHSILRVQMHEMPTAAEAELAGTA